MIALLLMACSADKGPASAETGSPETGISPVESGDTGESPAPEPVCAEQERVALEGDVCVSAAPCAWGGEQSYEYFGWAVASGGDVDGDGLDDVMVAAPVWDAPSTDGLGSDAGRVVLISGSGLAEPGDGVLSSVYGVGYAENLGTSVAFVGDVDGDGLDDALLGAQGDDSAGENAGVAWLVPGAEAGWAAGSVDGAALAGWTGESEYARVGKSVAGGGDVDGDGLDDMVLGGELFTYDGEAEDFRQGRAYLVLGSEAPPAALADADAALDGPDAYGGVGKAAALGDLDGDGYADALLGAPYGCSYAGCVYALSGGVGGGGWTSPLADAPLRLEGEATYDVFGWQLAATDLDGDGADEIVVGAPLSDRAYASGGAVWIYRGADELAVLDGPWDDWQLGSGVLGGDDLDGDGREELLLGAVASWTGLHTKAGRYWLLGGADTPPASLSEARAVIHGAAVKDYLGSAAAMGDLDADGKAELIVGSGYVNTEEDYDIGATWVFWGG